MPIPILTYHQIDEPAPRGTRCRGLTVSPHRFLRQMTWMHRLGYQGLAIRELMPYLQGQKQGKVFGLTFDDGFRNVYHHALPILNQLGFSATNYFVVHQLGHTNRWDHNIGVPSAPLMSLQEMLEWAKAGHEVGSHTLNHTSLLRLSPHEAHHQITHSKTELEQILGKPVTAFCYPYGHYRHEHTLMVHAAGYQNATTTQRGRAHSFDNIFLLPRITISRSTHLLYFFKKCLTHHEDNRRRA